MRDTSVYLGGTFSIVGNQVRNRPASVQLTSGALHAWNTAANAPVSALAVVGDVLYMGGRFTLVRGQPRERLAAVEALTGQLSAWDPAADGEVTGITPSGSSVFVHGAFGAIGGVPLPRVAQLDAGTGSPLFGVPAPNATVATLRVIAGQLYLGGSFSRLDGQRFDAFAVLPLTALLGSPPPVARGGSLAWSLAPNPSRGPISVEFALVTPTDTEIDVLDVAGRRIARLMRGSLPAGRQRVAWDGRTAAGGTAAPGVYLVRVRIGSVRSMHRLVVTR